jgi:hypothetical protein
MAIAAGKGPKTQKIGLKEQAPVLVQRVSDSASSQIACWSYRSATQGARGRLPQASRASLPPVPVPNPSGEERAADAPSSYNAPRSRPRLLTHAPHRDQHEAFEAIARTLPLSGAVVAETLTCSRWLDITTCQSPSGYASHESTWQGITTGYDNQGDRWTTCRLRDLETTTGEPPTLRRTGRQYDGLAVSLRPVEFHSLSKVATPRSLVSVARKLRKFEREICGERHPE